MTGDETRPQIEVDSDEDWKGRVKAEDAALDQQFREQGQKGDDGPASTTSSHADQNRPQTQPPKEFPAASFAGLIAMLSQQAMLGLGFIPNPATKKAETDLPMARYFIDLIGVVEQKTTGQLAPEEAAALDESLHSLRMAYVQCSKESA